MTKNCRRRLNPAVAEQAPSLEFMAKASPRAVRTRGRRLGRSAHAWLALAAVAIPAAIFVGYLILTKRGDAVAGAPRNAQQAAQESPTPDQEDPLPVEQNPPPTLQDPPLVQANLSQAGQDSPMPLSPGDPATKAGPPAAAEAAGGDSVEAKRFAYEVPDSHRGKWSLEGDELAKSSARYEQQHSVWRSGVGRFRLLRRSQTDRGPGHHRDLVPLPNGRQRRVLRSRGHKLSRGGLRGPGARDEARLLRRIAAKGHVVSR